MRIHDYDVEVLNELIGTTIDSADGYANAAEESRDGRYGAIFQNHADERRQVVARLQERVRALGGTPEDEGSVLASAHRWFVDLRQCLAKGDQAVIDAVERGEGHIKRKYEHALQSTRLSPGTQALIAEAYASVRSGHGRPGRFERALHEHR